MESRQYETEQGSVRYWTDRNAGSNASWLIFLPGLTADHTLFDSQMRHFCGKANCLTWDAPAHGLSRPYPLCFTLDDYARILHGILEREGITRPVLVGQSLGGYVSQAFMDLFPGETRGFISIDSAPLKRRYYPNWEVAFLHHTKAMYLSIPWKLLLAWGSVGVARTPQGRANMRQIMESFEKREYCELAAHGYEMLANAIEADRPYQVDCPALLLCGEHDQAGDTRKFNRKWTEGDDLPLIWVPGAGHNSNIDNPDFVNAQIENFMEKL